MLNEFGEALLELLDARGMSVQDLSDALRESPWMGGPGHGPGAGLLLACMTDAGDLANHATPSFLVGVGGALDLDTDEIERMLWAYYKVAEGLAHGVQGVEFDHVWYWTQKARPALGDRKGQRCRVLARGKLNSILVEFEPDGHKIITSRCAVRRARE